MNRVRVTVLLGLALLAIPFLTQADGQIYKVVNPDGSITYTDQKPSPGAQPVELKPLSVVETDIPVPDEADTEAAQDSPAKVTLGDLKRTYRDFRITQPQNEETFWGTGNQVVVSWAASEPPLEGMRVVLYVNGERLDVEPSGSVALTLERGEHKVYAVLSDARKRRIATTDTVTFFVKQHSVNFGQRRANPGTGP